MIIWNKSCFNTNTTKIQIKADIKKLPHNLKTFLTQPYWLVFQLTSCLSGVYDSMTIMLNNITPSK